MAGPRIAHATLKGPSVVKEIIIGITLGIAAGSVWKMHHWNEQRKVRTFYDLLEKGEIGVVAEEHYVKKVVTFKIPTSLKMGLSQMRKVISFAFCQSKVVAPGIVTSGDKASGFMRAAISAVHSLSPHNKTTLLIYVLQHSQVGSCRNKIMATIAGGVSLSSPRRVFGSAKGADSAHKAQSMRFPAVWRPISLAKGWPVRATPEKISEKVEESIKSAEEACSGGGGEAECAAAWDEVEELSAAASHAREKQKQSDPLENYCKENPETDECRTYDN
ncbi:hypothetical protein VNO78_20668 [Psophocarpus tetragonolobus]|uniref:CP12 domain-containing protein n=1 Tax=Psophocarpus tetragonolobus TaxID=3891 RepID=A0AAN9SAT0_PSOTE